MNPWLRGGAVALLLCGTSAALAQERPGEPGDHAGAAEPAAAGEEGREEPLPAPPWSLDLTVGDFGIGLGNTRHVDGLKLNYRDANDSVVHGVSVTVWTPYRRARPEVTGLLLGLPLAGADRLRGIGLGLGLSASSRLEGIGLGLAGLGVGGDADGLLLGGLGAGAGGQVRGLVLGGLGAGVGEGIDGILLGGLGVGSGGKARGLVAGGLGAGAGAGFDGIMLAGLGAGAGGSSRGLLLAGLGCGVGGDFDGIIVGGLGAGVGGTLRGIAVAGIGAGTPTLKGAAAALAVVTRDATGLVVAPLLFQVEPEGSFSGLAIGGFNRIRGVQRGLAIGLVNYAAELHGVQIGLVNLAGNNTGWARVLPLANAHLD